MGAFVLSLGCVSISEKISAWGICGLVAGLFFLIGGSMAAPCCYCFDEESITFYYLFLPKERYLWKNIRKINALKDGCSRSSISYAIFDIIFSHIFEITGKVEGKQLFYMQGKISRSMKTKRLLEKYWKRNIIGIKSKQ